MFDTNILILAAGFNKISEKPCSLWSLGNGKSILDWQIHAFKSSIHNSDIKIAIGYNYKSIIDNFSNYDFQYVFDWEKKGPLQTFLSITKDYSKNTLIMYGDTVFHPETLEAINNIKDDVVIVIDTLWKKRFLKRSKEDIDIAETLNIIPYGEVEYTGLIKLSPKAMKWISKTKESYSPKYSFIDLINDIRDIGLKTSTYDVAGNWAEMNEPSDLVHFILGSKAETLKRIQSKLTKSKVCDQINFTLHDWKNNKDKIIDKIQAKFKGLKLIIRSSSLQEDSWETAQAGLFESKLNINSENSVSLSKAIDKVFISYASKVQNNQVLVQPFITNVAISGVIFTCDIITGAPYYTINYDDVSGKTDTITSGKDIGLRTVILFHNELDNVLAIDPRLKIVIDAVRELEQLLGYDKLDIEFAIDKRKECFTFQIRPIVVDHRQYNTNENKLSKHLQKARQHFRSFQKKSNHLFGNFVIFSRMTDWNPAEIIGTRPNALAINLYNYLITDQIWAEQRAEFGYRDIRSTPLLYNFCAQPYVDCRASINSFIPSDLSEDCSRSLVEAYLDILSEKPHLHDKLELDVVFTIWVPTFNQDAKSRFKGRNISSTQISQLEERLKKITAKALVRLDDDISSIETLSESFNKLINSETKQIDKIYHLIEDCRKYGTLAFAHAARAGFVAVTLLKSLVKSGNLSEDRMLEFQGSVPTVASDFQFALSSSEFDTERLIKKFGHLRPGTYDVNQPAYWEKPDFYFTSNKETNNKKKSDKIKFIFNKNELNGFKKILDELNVDIKPVDFIKYLEKAIQAREETKFKFTRNLSSALDLIIQFGNKELGLSREDVGYLIFDDILGLRSGALDKKMVKDYVRLRKVDFSEKHLAKLPSIICSENDFFSYEQEKSEANFITRLNVIADLSFLKLNKRDNIKDKIVVIPNADPGFDWIFSHNIAGLITQYGGANSHMAIRCAELGIPAAIGIGDNTYENLHNGRLMLDCKKGIFEYV